jgi:ubiquinone/menaquinone biosynthesis C-methylase UbiE
MIQWLRKRPELSLSYADPAIADQQRKLVNQQLEAMKKGNPPEHFEVVGRFLSHLRTQTNLNSITLLDAGCGSGYYSEIVDYFVPGWAEYVGADFNPGMLDLARFYYPKLALMRMDVRNLGFQDRSFEMVMSGAVAVHIKEWKTALKELARVTRRWLLLHRTLVTTKRPTSVSIERHYQKDVYRVRINEVEMVSLMTSQEMSLVTESDAGEGKWPAGQKNKTYLFERTNV